jgi:hypothetical protein
VSKVFSEKEAADILQKAVKLQEAGGDANQTYTPGITVEELRRIAEEAGLDPKYLELALAGGQDPDHPKKWFLNLMQEHERVIEGELPPDRFDLVTDEVRSMRRGGLRQIGRALEGRFSKGWGFGWLRISSRNGRTRLQIRSNSLFPFLMTMYPAFIGGMMTASSLAEHGQGPAGLAAMLGALGLGFIAFRFGMKKNHETVAKLADTLTKRIEEENADLRKNLAQPTTAPVEPLTPIEEPLKTSGL